MPAVNSAAPATTITTFNTAAGCARHRTPLPLTYEYTAVPTIMLIMNSANR